MKRIGAWIFLAAFTSLGATPNPASGAETLMIGHRALAAAQGGAVATATDPSLVSENPAAPAAILRPSVTLETLGLGSTFNGFAGSVSVPTLYGVFSAGYQGLLNTNGSFVASNYHRGFLGFAKEISTSWRFGGNLWMDFVQPRGSNSVLPFLGVDLALVIADPTPAAAALGLGKLAFGLEVRNLGAFPSVLVGSNLATWRTIDLKAGLGFDWLRLDTRLAAPLDGRLLQERFTSRLLLDLTVTPGPFNLWFGAGLVNTLFVKAGYFDSIRLTGGYMLSTTNFGVSRVGSVAAALTLKFDFKPTELELSYTLLPETVTGATNFAHGLTLTMQFGKKDEVKPQIDLGDFGK